MSKLSNAHRRILAAAAALMSLAWAGNANAATGEENFTKVCAACHMIGGGKLVGPDLKDVGARRSEEWLLKFIKSPKAMIDAGDADAVALFKQFNLMMPDSAYSDAEIKDIIAFIATRSGSAAAAAPAPAPVVKEPSPAEIELGQKLFQGITRLKNGGPACNSCHHVKNDAVIGGGVLARELTTVFSNMGAPGINAILGKPPFPVMEQAYLKHPLTEDEVTALVGFLQDADKKHSFQQPRDFGFRLLWSGVGGMVPLMALYAIIWRRRKVGPVNAAIFDRQVKGEDDVTH